MSPTTELAILIALVLIPIGIGLALRWWYENRR